MDLIIDSTLKETVIVTVSGRLDALSYAEFEEKILSLYEERNRGVIIDFTKVNYVSSAGLRALLRAAKKMKLHEGGLALFGLNENVVELLKMAGFFSLFEIFDNQADAEISISKQLRSYK
ncbi:MAG: STAS domain-containing protein [Candidatus Cloacimonetes bacterium]|nr:STAS domain-containing protein [Candidatus Cloacimonadota bacterium]